MLDVLATLFIIVVSTTIASYIVARLVREPLHAASADDEDFVLDHEFKYLDEIEALDRLPLAEAAMRELRGCVATDDTPCGRVAVTYDPDEGRFDYWSERSQVPYKTLDAVARKFCVENDCRAIYLDVYEELYLEAVRTNRAALDAAALAVAEMASDIASGTASPASDDDRTNLYGDSAGDSAGGAGSAGSAGSYLDLDGDLDDDDDETKPLLERSAGTELDVAPQTEKAQAQQTEKAEKPSPFAAFKSYNAPAKRVRAGAAAGPERPTKNAFKRRGTYREWEAGIAAATLVAQHAAATGLAKTLPMAEEADARSGGGARRRRHFNISYDDFKRQTRSASAAASGGDAEKKSSEIEMVKILGGSALGDGPPQ